jgi:hypothetical protein
MMNLSLSNTKIGKNLIRSASFGLKAGLTCDGAGDCLGGCFALGGNYLYPSVANAQARRLESSLKDDFVATICEEIKKLRLGAIRIHDAGDYYGDHKFNQGGSALESKYLDKWIEIAKLNPTVIFYSYTKSVHFFKSTVDTWKKVLPSNFVITFSFGGKYDHLIDRENDKHALVFQSLEQLLEYGYSDTSEFDDNAYNKDVKLVGLIAKKSRKKDGWIKVFNRVTEEDICVG